MDAEANSLTSASLLGRVGCLPTDQSAWEEFVDRYGPKVYSWARHRGLPTADAEDVTQNVLLKMASCLQQFEYDPTRSFRGWLHTVTKNALNDFLGQSMRRMDVAAGGSVVLSRLNGVEAREDLFERLGNAFDAEVLEQAKAGVRLRVTPERWRAFEMTAFEGVAAAAVAEQLQMKVATVYTAKSQVQRMLQEEVRCLESSRALDRSTRRE
ncbi:MAG: sigma-70 family RNA polymerase sigma factor [Planctomycetota bacterium]